MPCNPIILARPRHMTSRIQPINWFVLAASLAFAKLVLFVLDSNPQVFLGDSMSYIVTAMNGWIPPDRSFVYGYIVYGLTARSRSLSSLVAIQTVAGIATAMLTAVFLFRYFRTSFAVAAAFAVAITLDPQHLLFERFVMTESLSTLVFALYLLFGLEYVQHRRLWALVALQAAGFALVAFRVTFVPMLVVATVAVPLLAGDAWRHLRSGGKRNLSQLGIHLLISGGLFFALHSAYKQWNGAVSERPPAYTYADGFFLISNVSPLVTAADTDNPELAAVLAQPLAHATSPETLNSRNSEMFDDNGLVGRIRRVLKDEYRANLEAKRIAYRTILRDPVGFARLAFLTHQKYYSKSYMKGILEIEAGFRDLGPDELKLLSHYHLDANGLPFMKTLTREYYFGMWPYYVLLANAPLVAGAGLLAARKDTRSMMAFVFVITAVHLTVIQVASVEPSTRHLHPAALPLALSLGVIVSRLATRTPRGSGQ